ncbi:uncharacterized protein HKW66_Vig0114100 [Vigna angularis]|uniref:Uncharacterized protein n=1 Tax=Phaseolus angularis TaxID=3914 RepID=A0A8T0L045_PHAAN|nr:uncharacterized protein HKW66_Vig0114100 [Vigna angularis]
MVTRWVERNECFVLKQRMVPFTVDDVCMGLGLCVGGLDVNFDDNFGVVVCQQFCSKSFRVKDVIRKTSMMIRERDIKDSLGLSGNVAVLQEEDRGNPIIRATLHLDEGPIPEDGGHELGMSWEEVVMKKIEDKQRKMVEMNKELRTLAAMVGAGKDKT